MGDINDKPDSDKKDNGAKRKLDEQSSTDKTDDRPVKKIKSSDNEETNSSTQVDNKTTTEATTLTAGEIYRVESPELGDFHIRSGAMGSFVVKAAGLKIFDSQEILVFPLPNTTPSVGVDVEVKDNLKMLKIT